jgi:hypothetical protein
MAKSNLKVKEPNELAAAIEAAAAVSKELKIAEDAFAKRFPFDHRLALGNMLGTALVDKARDNNDPAAARHSMGAELIEQLQPIFELRAAAANANREVERVRIRIEASVSEADRRSALAAAIESLDRSGNAGTKLRDAVTRANTAVAAAEMVHAEAVKAVADAVDAQAKTFEAAIEQGFPPARDSAVQDARRLVDAAADELATARTAAAALKAKLTSADDGRTAARSAVWESVRNVIAAEVPHLLEAVGAMQIELDGKRQVLMLLSDHVPPAVQNTIADFLEAAIAPFGYTGAQPQEHPTAAPWLAAIAALSENAGAPLPKV